MTQVERYWGSSWYYNPQRWATSDGYAPFAVVIAAWHAMETNKASEQLEAAIITRMAFADADAWLGFVDQLADLAFPESPADE